MIRMLIEFAEERGDGETKDSVRDALVHASSEFLRSLAPSTSCFAGAFSTLFALFFSHFNLSLSSFLSISGFHATSSVGMLRTTPSPLLPLRQPLCFRSHI